MTNFKYIDLQCNTRRAVRLRTIDVSYRLIPGLADQCRRHCAFYKETMMLHLLLIVDEVDNEDSVCSCFSRYS